MSGENKGAKQPETVEQQLEAANEALAAAQAKIAELEADQKDAEKLNGELQERLAAKDDGKGSARPTFKHEGKTYEVRYEAVRLGKRVLKAKDIVADRQVQKELVEMNSGAIRVRK